MVAYGLRGGEVATRWAHNPETAGAIPAPAPIAMTEYQATLRDNIPLTTRRFTPEGFLVAQAAVTRTGIFDYRSSELKLPGPDRPVKLMRSADSVFHQGTLDSIRSAVVTLNHPSVRINPENWNSVSVGNVIGEPSRLDDARLGADIVIRDRGAIQSLATGTEEISIGYDIAVRDAEVGVGYDYLSAGPLKVEHMALVPTGRSGKDVRVFDQKEERMGLTAEDLKLITDAISPMLKSKSGPEDTSADQITTALKPVLDEIESLKVKAVEGDRAAAVEAATAKAKAAADKLVADTISTERKRATILTEAMPLIPEAKRVTLKDAPVKDILVAAVGDAVPNAADQSEDYLKGVVDGMAKNRRQVDTIRAGSDGAPTGDANDAYNEMVKSLSTAYIAKAGG